MGECELASLLVPGDVRVVERVFAEDAIGSLASGERRAVDQEAGDRCVLSCAEGGEQPIDERDGRQFGTTAIVRWHERWRDPAGWDAQTFAIGTWLLRGGRWRIVASHDARPAAR